MKSLLLFVATLACGILSAASITWSAFGFTEDTSLTGTAYLLQYTGDGAVSTQDIKTYLETNGTSYSGSDFVTHGSTQTLVDEVGVGWENLVLSDVTVSSSGQFFTLIITAEGSFYLARQRLFLALLPGWNNMTCHSSITTKLANGIWDLSVLFLSRRRWRCWRWGWRGWRCAGVARKGARLSAGSG